MMAALLAPLAGCTTVDPGSDPVIPQQSFDGDFFYCHVWPELLVPKSCGTGDMGKGDPSGGCHFTPSAVSGMILVDINPAVDCGGGDHPVDRSAVGSGSAAQGDLQSVSFDMSKDYQTAQIFVRPSSNLAAGVKNPPAHPRAIFDQGDSDVNQLLATWASK